MTRKLNALYRPPTAVAYTTNGHTFWMIAIPKGGFWIGEGDDKHRIELAHDYALGQYPVTQALWRAVMGEDWPHLTFQGDERLMERVNWDDAQIFLNRLNALPEIAALNAADGQRFQLPTEAQWEYAARGGRYAEAFAYPYAGSVHLPEVGWYDENSQEEPHPVGRKQPNALGLYDMSGNVWEWCADVWQDDYRAIPKDGSARQGEDEDTGRVVRGGSWGVDDEDCRLSALDRLNLADGRSSDVGFRLARY